MNTNDGSGIMAINVNRRDFIKVSGMTAGGLLLPSKRPVATSGRLPLHKALGEGHSICPYCSVGCGLIVATDETGHISNVEGDPDHIINKGALDPKSVSVQQLSTSDRRLKTVKYRAPNSDQW
jgi:formate dehydrogenase major subunit